VRHLASCERCRDEVTGLAALPGLLHRLSADAADGPAGPRGEADPANVLPDDMITRIRQRQRHHRWATAAAVAVLAAAAGTGWAVQLSPHRPGTAAGTVLDTARAGGVTVLITSAGFTVYWFAPDTATTSACTGNCARRWPPVLGPVAAGPGVTGTLGTITRPDGTIQATWDGHPLYTATADTAPGQARGNNLDAHGGVWHQVALSGSGPSPASPAPASGADGYQY
jgi:predicted lipoprotein with Yx(FWY)xxD motif